MIYRNIKGTISVEEPSVSPDWADEEIPAFATEIIYVPESDQYWEISTAETHDPYTNEDAEERVEDIIQVLEQAGHVSKKRSY